MKRTRTVIGSFLVTTAAVAAGAALLGAGPAAADDGITYYPDLQSCQAAIPYQTPDESQTTCSGPDANGNFYQTVQVRPN